MKPKKKKTKKETEKSVSDVIHRAKNIVDQGFTTVETVKKQAQLIVGTVIDSTLIEEAKGNERMLTAINKKIKEKKIPLATVNYNPLSLPSDADPCSPYIGPYTAPLKKPSFIEQQIKQHREWQLKEKIKKIKEDKTNDRK